jgi:hypothetical protein
METHGYGWAASAASVAIGLLVGCGPSSSSNSADERGTSSDDGDSSGSEDSDPAYCDVTALPVIEPIWETTLIEATDRVAMNSDALFVATFQMWGTSPSNIRRYDLSGQEDELTEPHLVEVNHLAVTDEHLYFQVDVSQIRRTDLEGILDEGWSIVIPDGLKINGITIGTADRVLIYGDQETENSDTDAAVALFDGSGTAISMDTFGDPGMDERPGTATAGSNGGFYFAYSTGASTVIRSYDFAPALTAELSFAGDPSTRLIVERPDGLIGVTLDAGVWVSKLDFSGTELWRVEQRPCGVAAHSLSGVSSGDRIWGVVGVSTAPSASLTRLLFQIDFEGQLLGTHNPAFDQWNLLSIASNGEAVVIWGAFPNFPDGATGLARVW